MLYDNFKKLFAGLRGEVALFRAFIKSFSALGKDALAEEFHGNSYQAIFSQQRGAGARNLDVIYATLSLLVTQLTIQLKRE